MPKESIRINETNSNHEFVSVPQRVFLHDESQTLEPGAVLTPNGSDEGIIFNGDIVAKITLPKDEDGDPAKIIAIVDFGEIEEGGKGAYLLKNRDGKELPGWGRTESRFALMGLNYDPVSHTITYAALKDGSNEFGREINHHNYTLGIEDDQIGNKAISKKHFTVDIFPEGQITISDHSTNGTTLEFAKLQKVEQSARKSRIKSLGKRILG